MNMIYAGIGSRSTSDLILRRMKRIATDLANSGYTLRSGGAAGADSAFESGCSFTGGKKEIFTAVDATEEAIQLASKFHPAWDACNSYVRKLHARNMLIILGKNLDTPVDFIVCYTPDGKASGGTGQALRAAEHYKIPIYNLFYPHHFADLTKKYLS